MRHCALICTALFSSFFDVAPSIAQVIVNDSWADGGRDNGPDPLDSNWWTSSNPNGI